ncbi:hypothetical protein FHX10_006580 [Rhizobium sp. BK591]|nr:hypothetical protein [Rhizobium sp. BK591]
MHLQVRLCLTALAMPTRLGRDPERPPKSISPSWVAEPRVLRWPCASRQWFLDLVAGRVELPWRRRLAPGLQLPLGCGWIHSADRNLWTAIAEKAGFAIDRSDAGLGRQHADLGFLRNSRSLVQGSSHVWEQQLPRLVSMSDSAEDPLLPGAEWNPYVHAVRGFSNGVAPDPMSAADYLAYEQRAAIAIGERRWPIGP